LWILATILGLVFFFVILLSIPIDLRLTVEKEESFGSRVRIAWLFGLIGKDIERKKKERKPKKKKKKKERKWFKGSRHIKPVLALIKTRGFIRRGIKFIRDIGRVVKIRELRLDIKFGLDDPFDTAMIYGAIAPTALIANRYSPIDIRVSPDFDDLILRGSFNGNVRLIPIKLFKPIVLFVFTPVTFRAAKNMVFAYRK
jgi:hypothetical protein